jgi:predicted dithiol-disulfide oxidoreductase (DUF899 family)
MSQVADLEDLNDSGVSWVTVSNMPLAQLEGRKRERGWSAPIASSRDTGFATDCGADDGFMFSAFFTDGGDVFRTWNSSGRGVEPLLFGSNVLDRMVYGRQQDWEDSPAGWPQEPTYG